MDICFKSNLVNKTEIEKVRPCEYKPTTSYFQKTFFLFRTLSKYVGQALFFPYDYLRFISQGMDKVQQYEEQITQNYWNRDIYFPNLSGHKKVQELFDPPKEYELKFKISMPNFEDPVEVKFPVRIIETKNKIGDSYNFVRLGGMLETYANDICGLHPFLDSYTQKKPTGHARFVLLSGNDLNRNFQSYSIDQIGFIYSKALETLNEEIGAINMLVGHSVGCIFIASALKYLKAAEKVPKHLVMDRGPLSLWNTSKRYGGGLYRLGAVIGAIISEISLFSCANYLLQSSDKTRLFVKGASYSSS